MNTSQQYIPVWKKVELEWWMHRLYYRQIRGAESLLPGLTPAGKRLRGITLAPNFYLARDKHFYEVIDGIAKIRTSGPDSPPALFSSNHLTSKLSVSGIEEEATGLSSWGSPIVQTSDPVPFMLTMIVVASAFHLFSAIKFALYAIRTQPHM